MPRSYFNLDRRMPPVKPNVEETKRSEIHNKAQFIHENDNKPTMVIGMGRWVMEGENLCGGKQIHPRTNQCIYESPQAAFALADPIGPPGCVKRKRGHMQAKMTTVAASGAALLMRAHWASVPNRKGRRRGASVLERSTRVTNILHETQPKIASG